MTVMKRFSVSSTAYLRNLSDDDRYDDCIAIHFAQSPNSFIVPVLLVTNYPTDRRGIGEKVAAILEKHWTEE